jgi:hypothetical protein
MSGGVDTSDDLLTIAKIRAVIQRYDREKGRGEDDSNMTALKAIFKDVPAEQQYPNEQQYHKLMWLLFNFHMSEYGEKKQYNENDFYMFMSSCYEGLANKCLVELWSAEDQISAATNSQPNHRITRTLQKFEHILRFPRESNLYTRYNITFSLEDIKALGQEAASQGEARNFYHYLKYIDDLAPERKINFLFALIFLKATNSLNFENYKAITKLNSDDFGKLTTAFDMLAARKIMDSELLKILLKDPQYAEEIASHYLEKARTLAGAELLKEVTAFAKVVGLTEVQIKIMKAQGLDRKTVQELFEPRLSLEEANAIVKEHPVMKKHREHRMQQRYALALGAHLEHRAEGPLTKLEANLNGLPEKLIPEIGKFI